MAKGKHGQSHQGYQRYKTTSHVFVPPYDTDQWFKYRAVSDSETVGRGLDSCAGLPILCSPPLSLLLLRPLRLSFPLSPESRRYHTCKNAFLLYEYGGDSSRQETRQTCCSRRLVELSGIPFQEDWEKHSLSPAIIRGRWDGII